MTRAAAIFAILISPALAQEKVTYDEHVFPIFQQSCLNCHNPDKAKGGLDLSSFSGTMKGGSGGKIVEPGDVGSSLVAVIMHAAEPRMPPEGDRIAMAQVDIIKKWIEGGLLENKTSSARKPEKPKFQTAMQSDPGQKPDGPPPMPEHLPLEPPVVTARGPAVHSLATSPWAPLLAVSGQGQILLHHTETLDLIGILPFPEGEPVSLNFTPEGRYLIAGGGVPGKSGVTVTYDVTTGARLMSAAKEFDTILAADIRPGFDKVVTGGPSRLLKIWNTETGEAEKSIKKHTDWITALDISPDGVLIASGDRNGGVWVWESGTGNEFHTLRGHQAGITATAFRGDSNILATASGDGSVRFWEMNGGGEVKKIDAHGGGVSAFAFARDGRSITAGRDMKARLWKADFNPDKDIAVNLPALPTSVALDAEGKRAFVGDALGMVRVYETADGKATGEIPANPPTIAARLEWYRTEQAKKEGEAKAASLKLDEMKAAQAAAHKSLAEAEKALQQAVEIEKAAKNPGDMAEADAARLAENATARVRSLEQALPSKRQAIEATEKSLAEASTAHDAARANLEPLHLASRKWQAAEIHTRALAIEQEVVSADALLDEDLSKFSELAASVATLSDTLNKKRAERAALAALDVHMMSPQSLDELKATLAAVDIRISQHVEALASAEQATLAARAKIETESPPIASKKHEARDLKKRYFQMLQQGVAVK